MKKRTAKRLPARVRDELRFKQAMGLALMATDSVLVMGKGQEALQRGGLRSVDKRWVGLATRLEARLRALGLEPPKEDAWLHGSLNVLDYRCRVLSAFVEGLAEWPARPGEWEQLGNVVARMWAMVHTMQESFRDLEPALERLLVAICRVRSPDRHLKRRARPGKSRA